MKPVRLLLILLGVLVAVIALVAGLALTPALQRWAVMRFVAGRPDLKLQLEGISAGPFSVNLRGVQAEQHGVKISASQLEARYSLFQLAFGKRLEVDRLFVRGLTVDASRLSRAQTQAGATAAPAAAPATLAQTQLPVELVVGELDVEGRALLPGAPGKQPVQADFKVTGGQLAPGREGTVKLAAKLADASPGAQVTGLEANVTLQIKQSLQRGFDRVGVNALVEAQGPQLAGQPQLRLAAELARLTTGESYVLRLDTVRGGQSESVLALNALLPQGQKTFAGDWTLTARSEQLAPFMIGGVLPKFDVRGDGRFTLAPETHAFTAQGSLQGEASELERIQLALRAIGGVKLAGQFDVAFESGAFRVKKLEASLAGAQPVLDVRTTGVIAVNLKDKTLQASGGSSAGELLRLKIHGLPLAWVRPFVAEVDLTGGKITGELSVAAAEGGKVATQTITPLQIDEFTVVRAGRTLLAKGTLSADFAGELSATQVSGQLRGLTLKTAGGDSIQGRAKFSAPADFKFPIAVEGDFSADLPKLLTPFVPIGHVRSKASLDVTLHADKVAVRKLATEALDAKGQLIGSLTVTRAFDFDLVQLRAITTGTAEVELANLKFGQLPLGALFRPSGGVTLTGSVGPGDFVLTAQETKVTARAKTPLALSNVIVSQGRQRLLDNVGIQLSPVAEFNAGTLVRATSGEIALRDASGATLATFTAEAAQAADKSLRASLAFNFDLPAIASQPVLAKAQALAAGRASGEVRAALSGGATQIEARATLNGLVMREGSQALPVANLSFRGVVQPDGHLSLQAPILLDRAGVRSDLNFTAEGSRQNGILSVDAKLSGEHIELGDVLMLSAVAGAPLGSEENDSIAAHTRALSPPAADEKPFWTGLRGQLALDVKSVASGKKWAMTGLTGRVAIEPERLALSKLDAGFGENSRLAATGSLAFAPGLNPYQLTGDFSLTEFDAGKLFKAIENERAPTVEGIFTVKGKLEGQGLTLDDTLDRTRGQFDLTSRQGVFRGLKRSTDKLSLASKAVGLVGSLLGGKSAEKISNNAVYVDQLAQALGEFNYDQLAVKLVRDESLNLKLENIALVAPDVRLQGSGAVTYVSGKPLLEQPLSVMLSLASRGKVEQILGKLRVLDGSKDELGYARSKEQVTVGGTLARPDPTGFFTKLAASKLTDFLTPDS